MASSVDVTVKIHVNPRVYTEYNAMMNTWHIQVMCCGTKRLAAVTSEYLENTLKTPGELTWELFKLFQEFIIDHPYMRQLIMKLTHGSMEQNVSNEHLTFGDKTLQYSGYNIEWTPSPEFFAMDDHERDYWRKAIDNAGHDKTKHAEFFSMPKVVNSGIADYHTEWNDSEYSIGGYEYFAEGGHVQGSVATSGLRDPRVDLLPGVKEKVKHPLYETTQKKLVLAGTGGIDSYMDWTLEMVVIDLNDNHHWTREQIADWLETLDIDIRFRGEDSDERSRPQGAGTV